MRILQVTDNYAPAIGGLERTVQGLARELAARGHEVEVATLSRPDAPDVEQEGAVTIRRLSGLTRHLRRFSTDPGHHFHPTTADPQLVRRLQELVDATRPDIVHAHGWILHSCLRLRLPAGSALVVSLHDYSLVCAKKTMTHLDELDSACSGPSTRRCLSCANASYGAVKGTALALGLVGNGRRLDRVSMFLPVSAAVAGSCLAGIAPSRVRVIPPFVADDVATASGPRPDFLPDGDFVLFVGAQGVHKGLRVLAEAHQGMAVPVPLVVIGPRRADAPELSGTPERPVFVHNGLPHARIMAAFAAATAVAVPSRWPEPFGLVAVEAMAAGTAVVASRVGGLAEIVDYGVTGLLVEPGDGRALSDALDNLLADPVRRHAMGLAAAARAMRFTAGAVLPRVIDAYRRARAMTAV
ncbi:glycosyltransferase family 4 protein [Umezawaea sp. Da 62-37]|uniref:glycosyltransferase family 4 protein n=1 Tax=Umezawaea sp. Da 62-37 TaxID=3075927 RepID=UPI0028F72FA3|nr:glycosyltransferase family 4 protein [Umezawaea sp. Da 62-37]WNV85105.1 glycosyltransferase family 4 protein [Umezawaea sp. Da 62-37]